MKRVYLVRYGAYGDHIHMSAVIKAFDELGYHITFEYNHKGVQIHHDNPRIDEHVVCEASLITDFKDQCEHKKRHDMLAKQFDVYVNFSNSLEEALIAEEKNPEYFWPLRMRRAKNCHTCYYDQSMIWAGLTDRKFMGWTGEVYFDKSEHQHVWDSLQPYKDKFVILWCLRGTMWQKAVYPIAKDVVDEWLSRHDDSVVITTGDDFCKDWEWISAHGNTIAPEKGLGEDASLIHRSGRMPFRQALHLSSYVDLVVTPETGLGIGAGSFGTPKIMLLTAASKKNIVGNDLNDYSLQSDAWCSPCSRAIYNTYNCPTMDLKIEDTLLPICVDFKKERVLEQMEDVYKNHGMYNRQKRNEPPDSRPVSM